MYIECIKGFKLGGSVAFMQGEIFKLVDAESNTFVGVEGASRCPGMEIDFEEDQLCNNFKLTLTKVVAY
jgi:hypothetical protein